MNISQLFESPAVREYLQQYTFLKPDDVGQVLACTKPATLQRHEVFIDAGQYSYRFAFILNGIVRSYALKNGEEITLNFSHDYNVVASYECLLLNQPSSQTFQALERTEVLIMNFADMEHLYTINDRLALAGSLLMKRQLANAYQRLDAHLLHSPEERYERLLTTIPQLAQRVPQKYIASYLGIAPGSLSRIRRRMAQREQAAK